MDSEQHLRPDVACMWLQSHVVCLMINQTPVTFQTIRIDLFLTCVGNSSFLQARSNLFAQLIYCGHVTGRHQAVCWG